MRFILLGIAASLILGCHTMRFELIDEPAEEVVHVRKSFFFWGLTPYAKVDVRQYCPAGVAAVVDQMSFEDGLYTFWTLGIWELRSSWYYCLPEMTDEGGAE